MIPIIIIWPLRILLKKQKMLSLVWRILKKNCGINLLMKLELSQELLRVLGTEVTRLRLAIGHHKYGRMSDRDLWKIPEDWNGTRYG